MKKSINLKGNFSWKDWLRNKELKHWKLGRELCFNNFVKKNRVRSNWNLKILPIIKHNLKLLTFQDSKIYLEIGLRVSISISPLNCSENTLNMPKILKVWSSLLGNFSSKHWNSLDFPKIIWKRRDTGKIGQKRSLKIILLLNWEDPRKTQRKLLKKEKTKMKKTSSHQSGSIQHHLYKPSQDLSTAESKSEQLSDSNSRIKRKKL